MSEKENSKAQIEQNLSHTHTHSHEHTKEVSNRLARAIGHLQKVKQMVEKGDTAMLDEFNKAIDKFVK